MGWIFKQRHCSKRRELFFALLTGGIDIRKVISETYECEFCGLAFGTEAECECHEKTHLCDYKHMSNKMIADALYNLSKCAYIYRMGSTVMGVPISNFQNLLDEAAKRLMEMD